MDWASVGDDGSRLMHFSLTICSDRGAETTSWQHLRTELNAGKKFMAEIRTRPDQAECNLSFSRIDWRWVPCLKKARMSYLAVGSNLILTRALQKRGRIRSLGRPAQQARLAFGSPGHTNTPASSPSGERLSDHMVGSLNSAQQWNIGLFSSRQHLRKRVRGSDVPHCIYCAESSRSAHPLRALSRSSSSRRRISHLGPC